MSLNFVGSISSSSRRRLGLVQFVRSSAPEKSVPSSMATHVNPVPRAVTPTSLAPLRVASSKLAKETSAPVRSAPVGSARGRSAPPRFTPRRVALEVGASQDLSRQIEPAEVLTLEMGVLQCGRDFDGQAT